MKWEKVKLGDVCEITSSKRVYYSEYVKSGIPFFRSKEIIELSSGSQISEPLYISQAKYETIKEKYGIPKPGDMLLTSVGTIGIPYIVKSSDCFYFKDGNLTWFRNFKEKLLPSFLYHWVKSQEGYGKLYNITIGSSQKALTISALNNLEIPLPPLPVQKKIAGILSCYDDLIENCHKQIALLEEAAARLYKKWFIKMEYPGSDGVMGADGVPKGWERKSVFNCLKMYIGGGWGKECVTGKNTVIGQVIRGTDINDIKFGNFANIPIRYHTEDDMKKRSLQANDIIFELSNGNINNIGRTLLIDNFILKGCGKNTICASFCKLLRPIDRIHSILLYLEIQAMQADGRMLLFKKQGSNGINNFAFEAFLSHELLIPNDYLTVLPIENIISKISVLQRQVSLLAEARDLLLPRLMSGEVVV